MIGAGNRCRGTRRAEVSRRQPRASVVLTPTLVNLAIPFLNLEIGVHAFARVLCSDRGTPRRQRNTGYVHSPPRCRRYPYSRAPAAGRCRARFHHIRMVAVRKAVTRRGDRAVKFGLFYEFQLPRPWLPDSEYRLYQDGLAQIELADRLGYDCAWQVEHHFLEEYAHSPTPEMFLWAASQRTKNIRLPFRWRTQPSDGLAGGRDVVISPDSTDPRRLSRVPRSIACASTLLHDARATLRCVQDGASCTLPPVERRLALRHGSRRRTV